MADLRDPSKVVWKTRTDLLFKQAEINDAYEVEARRHKSRARLGLGLLAAGIVSLVVGLTLDKDWLGYAALALQVPVFSLGLHLMAGQEVKRLKREVEAIEVEIQALDSRWEEV
ncbi:MAG: hypothetical protein HKO65_04620 [Gemmatimonadetes bacterium]|nr:hypothetical protein [Gemmatimonadota bacterium]